MTRIIAMVTTVLTILALQGTALAAPEPCPVIINGSFEHPGDFDKGWRSIDAGSVAGWQTTAADNKIEIWVDGFLGVDAYSGGYINEINANMPGMIYQNITTTPGTHLRWEFAHRGRKDVDTVRVWMGAPGELVEQATYSTGPGSWVVYSGVYTVPEGDTTTQFGLEGLDSGTVANLIDAVSIAACDYPDKEKEEGDDSVDDPVEDPVEDDDDTDDGDDGDGDGDDGEEQDEEEDEEEDKEDPVEDPIEDPVEDDDATDDGADDEDEEEPVEDDADEGAEATDDEELEEKVEEEKVEEEKVEEEKVEEDDQVDEDAGTGTTDGDVTVSTSSKESENEQESDTPDETATKTPTQPAASQQITELPYTGVDSPELFLIALLLIAGGVLAIRRADQVA